MNDEIIIKTLTDLYGDQILPITNFPKAYCPGKTIEVRAIYLGCDPSNMHCRCLPYAFAHESGHKIFNKFIQDHTDQLGQIGLSWGTVYTQNLCRNYFKEETSKNRIWKQVAKEFWVERLNEELNQFDPKIPVLLTSQILLEVLGFDGYEKKLAPEFYECKVSATIPANKNLLNRNLIPLYRGKSPRYEVSYHLKNEKWSNYKKSILNLLNGL